MCIEATVVLHGCTQQFHCKTPTCLYKYSLLYQQKSISKEFYSLYVHDMKPGHHSWYMVTQIQARYQSNQGSIPRKSKNFSFLQCIQIGGGVHPAPYSVGTGALTLGVKVVQCEAGHLSPSTAKFKHEWSYASMPHILLRILWAQLYLTFVLVNVWYLAMNIGKCVVLATNSSTVHISNCPWRKAWYLRSFHCM